MWREALKTNLADQLDRLTPDARRLLDRATAVAVAHNAPPYLVGGGVRDLLLGRDTIDLDVVVVGDAVAIARALHADLGGDERDRLRVHDTFGTANLALRDGPALDLITARHEVYPEPGALPVVVPGTLDEDLRRRDFTINAIALALAPADFGALIDPLDGQRDLAARTIRILHPASFTDDPTRLLRAIRYVGRLSFALASETADRFRAAVAQGALATVSVQRLSHEFVRLLAEPAAGAMLDQLAAFDLLATFAPRLRWDGETRAASPRLDQLWPLAHGGRERPFTLWAARFALLVAHLAPEEARTVASDLHLTAEAIELAGQVALARASLVRMVLPAKDSALGHLLDPFDAAAVAVLAALAQDEATRARLAQYLAAIRPITPTLTGTALRELGVPPGPIYRTALQALRDYRRDQPRITVEEEQAFLVAWLGAQGGWPPQPPNAGGSTSGRG